MGAEIRVAGFTLTADEWDRFEDEIRAELELAARGSGELEEEIGVDAGADVLW
jgi:hypothetical protein